MPSRIYCSSCGLLLKEDAKSDGLFCNNPDCANAGYIV